MAGDEPDTQLRCDLVLEGGGVKGIALVGVLDVLEERGYAVRRVAGTSAGAVVGALVAAGVPRDERLALLRDMDWRQFQDESRLDRLPGGRVASLLLEQGVYEGEFLRRWLAEQLDRRGVHTFADLALEDPGAAPAEPAALRSRLLVMASDVSAGRLRTLPDDCDAMGCGDASAMRVVDAVRASMSIPFFYEPARLPGTDGHDRVLVDGGMLSNFPVSVFDRTDGRAPRWPTFGVKLSARPGAQAPRNPVEGVLDLTKAMISTMTGFFDQMHLDDASVLARTVFVDTFDVKATDFDLDRAASQRLYDEGRRSGERFLDDWDFDAYVAQHRAAAVGART